MYPVYRNRIVEHGEESAEILAERFRANPLNWREHPEEQDDAVDTILTAVGFVKPLIFNIRTGLIIDGHERLALALRNKSRVPYVAVDLDVSEERQILAVLDAVGQMAKVRKDRHTLLMEMIADTAIGRQTSVRDTLEQVHARRHIGLREREEDTAPTVPERPSRHHAETNDDGTEKEPDRKPREALHNPILRGPELRFDRYAIPMDDDELSSLIALYEDWVEENGDGADHFVAYLLQIHQTGNE
jgi:hypothetical protein